MGAGGAQGKLYHYVGDPDSKAAGKHFQGILRRLQDAGFSGAAVDHDAHGVVAAHKRVDRPRRRRQTTGRPPSSSPAAGGKGAGKGGAAGARRGGGEGRSRRQRKQSLEQMLYEDDEEDLMY